MDENNRRDKRLIERNYTRATEKELQTYLKSLPDDTANAQWVEVELHDTELGSDNLDEAGSGNSGNHSETP